MQYQYVTTDRDLCEEKLKFQNYLKFVARSVIYRRKTEINCNDLQQQLPTL